MLSTEHAFVGVKDAEENPIKYRIAAETENCCLQAHHVDRRKSFVIHSGRGQITSLVIV
jgi:mannose-6-phosphate isomerase-like protein (cupin superfamily)